MMLRRLVTLMLFIQLSLNGLLIARACGGSVMSACLISFEKAKAYNCCSCMCSAQKGAKHRCDVDGAKPHCGISASDNKIYVLMLGAAVLPSCNGLTVPFMPCGFILQLSTFYQSPDRAGLTPPPKA